MQQICGKQAPLEPNKLSGVLVELAAIVGRSGSGKSSLMAMAVIDAATDDLIGILPSSGGHHDSVIIPTKLEHISTRGPVRSSIATP